MLMFIQRNEKDYLCTENAARASLYARYIENANRPILLRTKTPRL